MVLVVKKLPDNAGDTGDVGSVPGSGRSPGVGNGNPLQCPWRIPGMGEPVVLRFMGSRRVGHD